MEKTYRDIMRKRKTVVINGARLGIGKAIAKSLEDCNLILLSRKMKTSSGKHYLTTHCDCTDSHRVNKVIGDALLKFGNIDVLINVAGILKVVDLVYETEENFDNTMNVNLKGYWNFVKAVLPNMIDNKKGYIINVSSMQAKRAFRGKSSYAMSKSAVNSLTESINREYSKCGVKSTVICPGFVDTGMIKYLKKKSDRILKPDDIAKTITYLLSLSDNAIVQEIHIERELW